MNALNKFIATSLIISLIFWYCSKINIVASSVSLLVLYGLFIVLVSFYDALNVKNADVQTIKKYNDRILRYKNM